MDWKNKKFLIILAVAVVILILVIFLVATGKLELGFMKKIIQLTPLTNELAGQDAYSLALQKAQEWQADAVLVYLTSGNLGESKKSDSWSLIFASPQIKQKGYEVKISDKKIISVKEIDYVGSGEVVPLSFALTPEQAVEKVKAMPQYQNAEILSVDAVFGRGTKTWYWGVKTSKGTVSVEAR